MKRTKRILVLTGVLAVCCIAAFATTRYEEKKEAIKNSDEIIWKISPDSVESLSWSYGDSDLSFRKADDSWLYEEDEAFPVSEARIAELLTHFEAFGVSFTIENVEDYAQYGLEDPECTISLTVGEEAYTMKLGNFSKMDEKRYIDIGDGNVYLSAEDPMDYLEEELSGMILNDTIPTYDSINSITLAGAENYNISHEDENTVSYSDDDLYFTEQDGERVPLDTSSVKSYLKAVKNLSLTDYVTYNASDEELASYGMHAPDLTITLDYTYTNEDENKRTDTLVVYLSQNQEELAAYEEAVEKEAATLPAVTKYVRIGDSQIVYTLDDSAYESLTAASYDDLRHKEVFWGDFDSIKQIEVVLEGETHTLTAETDEKDKTIWYYEENELDASDLSAALSALTADTFTKEVAEQKEELSLTLTLDNENVPQVDITLYRYDGASCLAVVDGETVCLVPRSSVVDLIEALQNIFLN